MSVAEIGIIGGSGFYKLLGGERELTVQTPYGPASDVITVGEIAGRQCAFLARHGRRHHLPPHKIPYRANIFALKELGVSQIIGTNAVGALDPQYKVGDFVFADQLVDFTMGTREDTFYDGPITTHISFAEPYCPAMRKAAIKVAADNEHPCHGEGTIVVVNGPRFPTAAESAFFKAQGWQLENMTQYPEAALARELTLSYMNLSLVTNSHAPAGEETAAKPTNASDVIEVLKERIDELHELVSLIVGALPDWENRPDFIREALNMGRWV